LEAIAREIVEIAGRAQSEKDTSVIAGTYGEDEEGFEEEAVGVAGAGVPAGGGELLSSLFSVGSDSSKDVSRLANIDDLTRLVQQEVQPRLHKGARLLVLELSGSRNNPQ
jgi:hypothetical protein